MIFKEQPTNRNDQVKHIKCLLGLKFDKMNQGKTDKDFKWSYEHSKMVFVHNTFGKYIRSSDNSLRGFKTRCTASFK